MFDYINQVLKAIPNAHSRYVQASGAEIVQSMVDMNDLRNWDGLCVSILIAIFSTCPEATLRKCLMERNLLRRSRLQSDNIVKQKLLFHAQWLVHNCRALASHPSVSLVSPRFQMAWEESTVSVALMLTCATEEPRGADSPLVDEERETESPSAGGESVATRASETSRWRLHFTAACNSRLAFQLYVGDDFISEVIEHHFGERPWARIDIPDPDTLLPHLNPPPPWIGGPLPLSQNGQQQPPSVEGPGGVAAASSSADRAEAAIQDSLRIGVIVISQQPSQPARMRRGTDLDALPSMSSLLLTNKEADDTTSGAIREILASHVAAQDRRAIAMTPDIFGGTW